MKKIDWKYWLKCRTWLEIEAALLSLGLNPEDFLIDDLGGYWIVNIGDLGNRRNDYDKRIALIRQYRNKSYQYMVKDGEWGDYFSATKDKVFVTRFLLWIKNEDMGWDLPSELMASIQEINNIPKNEIKALPGKIVPVQVQQDKNVLVAIEALGHKPLALPPQLKPGTRSFKAEVREYCISNHNFTPDTFDNTWKRLKADSKIKSGS